MLGILLIINILNIKTSKLRKLRKKYELTLLFTSHFVIIKVENSAEYFVCVGKNINY